MTPPSTVLETERWHVRRHAARSIRLAGHLAEQSLSERKTKLALERVERAITELQRARVFLAAAGDFKQLELGS